MQEEKLYSEMETVREFMCYLFDRVRVSVRGGCEASWVG